MCVGQTAIDLEEGGFDVFVVADADGFIADEGKPKARSLSPSQDRGGRT